MRDAATAFPVHDLDLWGKPRTVQTGMSLRQYYKAAALPVAATLFDNLKPGTIGTIIGVKYAGIAYRRHAPKIIAQLAAQIADAMVAEEERQK